MENIFENAKYGDKFLTRDGLIGLFIQQNGLGDVVYICQPKGCIYCERIVRSNGLCLNGFEDSSDIIGKLEEPINEEELDRLAKENYPYEDGVGEARFNSHQHKLREAYKAGYRKAKEE